MQRRSAGAGSFPIRERPGRPDKAFSSASVLLVAIALVIAGLEAWHPFATTTSRPGARFQDPDAAFHARRAERAVKTGSLLPPAFDAFENFPEGGRAVWPPLHDAALALLARAGGSTPSDPRQGMKLAAAFPVVELVLTLVVAALLAGAVGGPRGAVCAAFLFASMPTVVERGAFGEIDHNMTEVLGALLLLAVALRITRRHDDTEGRNRMFLEALFWAGSVLLALGFHAGLVLAAGIAAAATLAATFFEGKRGGESLAAGFALAAVLLPFFAGSRVRPDPSDPWRLGPVYALVLAIASAGTALAALGLFLNSHPRIPSREGSFLVAGTLGASLIVIALTPRASWGGLLRGLGFIGARDPWLSSIQEFQAVWTNVDVLRGALPGLLAAPVALVAAAASRPGRRALAGLLALSIPFAMFVVLGLLQQRFLPLAAAFAAAAGGAAFGLTPSRRGRLFAVGAGLLGLVFAGPILVRSIAATLRAEADLTLSAPEITAAVLKESTPDPGDPPAWGVLAPWDYGHAILRDSGRAVALDNFGSWHPGVSEKLALLVQPSPSRAVAEMSRRRLRYVVVPYPPPAVYGIARALGRSPLDYLVDDGKKMRVRYLGTPLGEATLIFRLHRNDGRAQPADRPADREALGRFRKLWESPEGSPETGPYMKIFELLPGE